MSVNYIGEDEPPRGGQGMDAQHDGGSPTDVFAAPARSARHSRRPVSRVRARRPALLLAALVAGGLGAGMLGLTGPTVASAQPTTVAAAERELLDGDDGVEVLPQASITMAEAQARLQQVAAARAQRAAAEEAAREAARPKATLPVRGATLSSQYGPRWGEMHAGIDFAAPMLTPELAAMDGVVLRAGAASGFGLAVYILHENGDVTVYGHMETILVEPGQYVQAGDKIALLGSRGQSTGPHLHFEVHQGGIEGPRIDPIGWLAARGVHV